MTLTRRLCLTGSTAAGLALALAGCSTPVTGGQFMADAQLIVTIAKTVTDAMAAEPGVNPNDIAKAKTGLDGLQAGLVALQSGLKTPSDFASLVQTEAKTVGPLLLDTFHANANMRAGVNLLIALAPVIAAEIEANQAPKATLDDPRAKARAWLATRR